MIRVKKNTDKNSFLELLLDEKLCVGALAVPRSWIFQAGGRNYRLKAKQKYELLLRIASEHGFALEDYWDNSGHLEGDYVVLEDNIDEVAENATEAIKTDCYLIGKYSAILQQSGFFEAAVSTVLEQAKKLQIEEEIIGYLEEMLCHGREYDLLEEAVAPVLIYKGTEVCNNILNVFAEQLGEVLEKKGWRVEFFNGQKDPLEKLVGYMGRHFKAIIGIQTYLFGVKLADEVTYLHQQMRGPKFHLILDHPIWLKQQLTHDYTDFYVLTHDRNYMHFVQNYYKKNAIHFPIPGIENKNLPCEKLYDFSFVGSIGNYKEQLHTIRQMDKQDRYLANHMLLVMRKNTHLSAEQAFEQAYNGVFGMNEKKERLDAFYRIRSVIYLIMDYYRYQILKTILDSGIKLDVFGDFWKDSLVGDHPNLICHPSVSVEESLAIFAQSKLSLNVMSWHKDGYTERIANIMLGKAVLVTDETTYLMEQYQNEKELVMFSLDKLEELPKQIKQILDDELLQKQIAEAGYQKTKEQHTWEKRAEDLIDFLQEL